MTTLDIPSVVWHTTDMDTTTHQTTENIATIDWAAYDDESPMDSDRGPDEPYTTVDQTTESEAYCVRGGCGQIATHIVSTYSVLTDQLVQAVTLCKLDVPSVLMGHNETVYARFVEIAA
jgi:hypothetical protein